MSRSPVVSEAEAVCSTSGVVLRVFLCLYYVATAVGVLTVYGQTVLALEAQDSRDELTLTAELIVERALHRAEKQDESHVELGFESRGESQIESINGDGVVTKTETAGYLRYALEGLLYDELVEKDGMALSDDDARKEQERKAKFVREAQSHAARGEEYIPNDMDVGFDRELMERYKTNLAGNELVRGHFCWVIEFEPRDGRLPDNRRMDKALNRSTGRLWISQEDYGVVRVAFEMQRPFRYLWGLVATLRHADGRFDFERIAQNFWAPVAFDLTLDLRVLFRGIHRHILQRWTDYNGPGLNDSSAP